MMSKVVLLQETWHPGWGVCVRGGGTRSQLTWEAGNEHKVGIAGDAGHLTSEEQEWPL